MSSILFSNTNTNIASINIANIQIQILQKYKYKFSKQGRDCVFNSLLHSDTKCPLRPIFGGPRLLASFHDDYDDDCDDDDDDDDNKEE